MSIRVSNPAALFLLSSALTVTGQAQSASQSPHVGDTAPGPGYTLRTSSRIVVIDITVKGQDGKPVTGLKASDFSLLEDGRLQRPRSFEEHTTATAPAKPVEAPKLAPGIFTNFTPAPVSGPLNIVLLDTLNTPFLDQAYAKQQFLDFLRTAPSNTPIAIFGLSRQLFLLQGFTTNPEVLKAALKRGKGKMSSLLTDPSGSGSSTASVADLPTDESDLQEASAALDQFTSEQEAVQLQLRARYTLDGLNQLGHYLENIPGRKNLIWFSGSFPVNIMPNPGVGDAFAAESSGEAEFRETMDILTRSQVAVYPVDARGLRTNPAFSAASSSKAFANDSTAASRQQAAFASQTAAENGTMLAMAEETGGQAYLNTNGLKSAVASAIADGSDYYTIAYTPQNQDWNGQFRKVTVQIAGKPYTLTYRKGYYADPSSSAGPMTANAGAAKTSPGAPSPAAAALSRSLLRGAPPSSDIQFTVRVRPLTSKQEASVAIGNHLSTPPAKGPFQHLAVDFAANPRSFTFLHDDAKYHDALNFIVYVLDRDGNLVNQVVNTLHADLDPQVYANFQRKPFSYNEDISVPTKGEYFLRIAVQDLNSSRIGSFEIPVDAVRSLPPLDSEAPK